MLMFNAADRGRVAGGEISVTYRLWKRAHVKPGRVYATGFGDVLVEDVQVIPAAFISADDLPGTGYESIQALLDLVGEHKRVVVSPDTLLHRVEFRFLGHRAPTAVVAVHGDAATVAARLARMDRMAAGGPWTRATLGAIEGGPRLPARLLAADMGIETPAFKAKVRKLKSLGLTTSFEIGYELTDLGRAVLLVFPDQASGAAGGGRGGSR